jgi:steroid delta-isomerase
MLGAFALVVQTPETAALAEPLSAPLEVAIRSALSEWTLAFNAGDTGAVCNLFAPDLRYDYRGFPERGFVELCGQLQASLTDPARKLSYDLAIKEIMVTGDMA